MKILAAAFAAACVAIGAPAFAQSASPAPVPKASPAPAASPAASPSPSPSPTPKPWVPSGFADTSYSAVSTSKSFQFGDGANSRVFDTVNRQPMLNNLNLQLQHNGVIGGKLELSLGSDADVIASYPTANNNSVDITNAYLSASSGQFTLIAGKFSTLAGAEVLESPGNLNFSRSILFGYAIPFTHTGARLTWAATSTVSVIAGINNGWDNTKGSGGPLTAEGGLAYTNKNLTWTAQGYSGTERVSNAAWTNPAAFPPGFDSAGHRSVIDSVATYKFGPVVTGTLNYDYGYQGVAPIVDANGALLGFGHATWNGLAGYASAAVTPKVTVTGRYEVFNDPQGYRSSYAQKWGEGTLTFAYAPSTPLLFRLEVRADHSNVMPWVDGNGNPISRLSSIGLEGIVKF
ncbi:MAG TPA: outer membrane beta-barrel protein [Candidatus Elarobacter sp.]